MDILFAVETGAFFASFSALLMLVFFYLRVPRAIEKPKVFKQCPACSKWSAK